MTTDLVDQITSLLKDVPNDRLAEIRDSLNDRLALHDQQKEDAVLSEWIVESYGDCLSLRMKIDNEGTGYFYSSYTTVPVNWDTYEQFVEDCESCYCGQNCLTNKKHKR